eukprot:6137710-Amphidinium_carterae.1
MGKARRSPLYPSALIPASISEDDFWKNAKWKRACHVQLVRSCGSGASDLELWRKTLEERDCGYLDGPYTKAQIEDLFEARWCPIRRFPVLQATKLRPIDDGRENGVNNAFCVTNKLTLHDVDVLGVLVRVLMDSLQNRRLEVEGCSYAVHPAWGRGEFAHFLGRRLDLKSAYKQLGISPQDRGTVVVAVHSPESGGPSYFVANSMLFGTTSAVYAFNRSAMGLWWLACTQMLLLCTDYFDDFPTLECRPLAMSSKQAFEMLLGVLGWRVSEGDKSLPFNSTFEVLGVEFDLHLADYKPYFAVKNKPQRVEDLTQVLESCVSSRSCSRKVLEALVGKLQFARGQLIGHALVPALTMLYRKLQVSQHVMNFSERDCGLLKLAIDSLRVLRESSEQVKIGGPSEYTQMVLVKPTFMRVPESLSNMWLARSKSIIAEVELLAIVWIKILMSARIRGKRVVYYIDNEGVRMNLIRGSSNSLGCAELLRVFFEEELKLPSLSWYARVPSKSNPADAPSRFRLQELRDSIGEFSLLGAEVPRRLLTLSCESAS